MEEGFEGCDGVDGERHGLLGRHAGGDLGGGGDVEEGVFLEAGQVWGGVEGVAEAEDGVADLVA